MPLLFGTDFNGGGGTLTVCRPSLVGSRAAQSSVVVITSRVDQAVKVFTPGDAPVASIGSPYPSGVALDRTGKVYFGQPGGVEVYKNDYKTLLLTLKLGIDGRSGAYPNSVAVDRGSGVVAVTTTVNGPGYLSFF